MDILKGNAHVDPVLVVNKQDVFAGVALHLYLDPSLLICVDAKIVFDHFAEDAFSTEKTMDMITPGVISVSKSTIQNAKRIIYPQWNLSLNSFVMVQTIPPLLDVFSNHKITI